jgi:lipoprotein NlpD
MLLFITGCGRRHPAPVKEIHHGKHSSKVNSSQPLSKQNKYQPKYVVVRKGDTLYSIGFGHNIDYKYLAKINGISAPYSIYPGQKLRLMANKAVITPVLQTHPVASKKPIKANNSRVKKPINKTPTVLKQPVTHKPVVKKPVVQLAPSSNARWIWPVKGRVISSFSSTDISRKGIDIAVAVGSSVYASNNGTVVYSGDGLRGYGELIIVKHSNNLLSAYAHNTSRMVKEGAVVKQGQVIAKSGKGTDGKALLHFEIRKNGQPVNPLKYLPKK